MLKFTIWVLSRLPFPVYYGTSTTIFWIMYHLIGYRKELVMKNLRNAFPDKSEKELHTLRKAFYKHLADYLIETVANFRMDLEDFHKRYKLKNIDLMDDYYERGINVILAPGHYGNWEWFSHLVLRLRFTCAAIYQQQSNKFFNDLIHASRGRFGLLLFRYTEAYKYLSSSDNTNPFCILYLADQRPRRDAKAHWVTFMNQPTSGFRALESLHWKMKGVVLYVHIQKKKRGHYEVEFKPLNEPGEVKMTPVLIERYFQALEKNIREDPRFYLWSHNRWKFDPPAEVLSDNEEK